MKHLTFAVLISSLALSSHAADLEPTLGKKGKLLLEEKFDGGTVPTGWNKNTGVISVSDGALKAGELASDKHIGAFRKPLLVQDCAIQLDFKFEGATRLDVGFDPAPGELKKKGHLFSLTLTPATWNLTEHVDKGDPKSKNKAHATAKTEFEKGKWYTLLLENKGNEVVARVDGKEPLRASSSDFHVKKPGLVFRAGGKDGQEVHLDNVKVWELK
jgi:hypothetical protein